MKLSVEELRKALRIVDPAVSARSPKPILTNVLLADGTVTATDLEMRVSVPVAGITETVVLPYSRLRSIVDHIQADEISLRREDTKCIIAASGSRWTLPTENPDEFPVATASQAKPIARLPADQFVMLLTPVLPAASKTDGRRSGVQIEFVDGTLFLVATDGHRLAVSEAEIDQATDDAMAFVPRRAAEALLRAVGNAETVQLETTGRELIADLDGTTISAVLLQDPFPNWRKVEKDHGTQPTLAVASALLHCCTLASVCASEQSRGVQWSIGKKITLSAKSSEYGESVAQCDVGEAGHACSFTINPQYAADWLSRIDASEEVSIEAKDSASAVVLRNETSRITIMPLAE